MELRKSYFLPGIFCELDIVRIASNAANNVYHSFIVTQCHRWNDTWYINYFFKMHKLGRFSRAVRALNFALYHHPSSKLLVDSKCRSNDGQFGYCILFKETLYLVSSQQDIKTLSHQSSISGNFPFNSQASWWMQSAVMDTTCCVASTNVAE